MKLGTPRYPKGSDRERFDSRHERRSDGNETFIAVTDEEPRLINDDQLKTEIEDASSKQVLHPSLTGLWIERDQYPSAECLKRPSRHAASDTLSLRHTPRAPLRPECQADKDDAASGMRAR